MGISYTDDLSGKAIDRDMMYQLQITKFESDTKLMKSRIFYVGLDSLENALGNQDFKWETITKGHDGKWQKN